MTTNDLAAALQQQGVTVSRAGSLSKSAYPFSVSADHLLVNGESVYAFHYPNDSAAERDAQLVTPGGDFLGTTAFSWIAPPHFYKGSSIIVLHVGMANDVTRALTSVFGPQFAPR